MQMKEYLQYEASWTELIYAGCTQIELHVDSFMTCAGAHAPATPVNGIEFLHIKLFVQLHIFVCHMPYTGCAVCIFLF